MMCLIDLLLRPKASQRERQKEHQNECDRQSKLKERKSEAVKSALSWLDYAWIIPRLCEARQDEVDDLALH